MYRKDETGHLLAKSYADVSPANGFEGVEEERIVTQGVLAAEMGDMLDIVHELEDELTEHMETVGRTMYGVLKEGHERVERAVDGVRILVERMAHQLHLTQTHNIKMQEQIDSLLREKAVQ